MTSLGWLPSSPRLHRGLPKPCYALAPTRGALEHWESFKWGTCGFHSPSLLLFPLFSGQRWGLHTTKDQRRAACGPAGPWTTPQKDSVSGGRWWSALAVELQTGGQSPQARSRLLQEQPHPPNVFVVSGSRGDGGGALGGVSGCPQVSHVTRVVVESPLVWEAAVWCPLSP